MNSEKTKKNISNADNQHNPFELLKSALGSAMSGFYELFEPFNPPAGRLVNVLLSPAIDIVDSEDEFKIEVEMPGMDIGDVSVTFNDNILTIKGEKNTSKQDKCKNYKIREINYGRYERSVLLPDTVDVNKAKASFKKGMLWVVIPKKPESIKKHHSIQIEKM